MAADDHGGPPHLFWTPPKAWMLALMDKGQPLRKKAHSVAGKHLRICEMSYASSKMVATEHLTAT